MYSFWIPLSLTDFSVPSLPTEFSRPTYPLFSSLFIIPGSPPIMPLPLPLPPPSTLLHRIRFFDHSPSPITALAFAPIPLPPARDPSDKGKGRLTDAEENPGSLIVARENGEVEIWLWARGEEERSVGNWILYKVGAAGEQVTLQQRLLSAVPLTSADTRYRPFRRL